MEPKIKQKQISNFDEKSNGISYQEQIREISQKWQ